MKSAPHKLVLVQESVRILTSKADARACDTTLPVCPTGVAVNGRQG